MAFWLTAWVDGDSMVPTETARMAVFQDKNILEKFAWNLNLNSFQTQMQFEILKKIPDYIEHKTL